MEHTLRLPKSREMPRKVILRRHLTNGVRAQEAQFELLDSDSDFEWLVRGTLQNGSVNACHFDKNTHLVTREISRRAFHPDVDLTELSVETCNSEPV